RLEGAEIGEMDDARAMDEGRLREARRDFLDWRPVREAGAEYELVAVGGELAEDALGVLRVEDVVEDGEFHLVAELLLDRLDGEAVLLGPADLGDGRDIGDADLERPFGGKRHAAQRTRPERRAQGAAI